MNIEALEVSFWNDGGGLAGGHIWC